MWISEYVDLGGAEYRVWRNTSTNEVLPGEGVDPGAIERARRRFAAAHPATFALPAGWDWRVMRDEIAAKGSQATWRGRRLWARRARAGEEHKPQFLGGPGASQVYVSTIRHDKKWQPVRAIDWSLYEKRSSTKIAGVVFRIGASIMLAYAGAAALAWASGGTAAASGSAAGGATGATAGGTAAVQGAELAALIESGTVGTAGAALEAAALSGAASSVGTVAGVELAQLVESGAVGLEGAALESAALAGESVAFNTATGALIDAGAAAPGLPQIDPPRPPQQPKGRGPLDDAATAAKNLATKVIGAEATRQLTALFQGSPENVTDQAAPRRGPSPPEQSPIAFLIIAGLVAAALVG